MLYSRKKGGIDMSFVTDFECAIQYIEENLASEIDINIVARKAKCSSYHFHSLIGTDLL